MAAQTPPLAAECPLPVRHDTAYWEIDNLLGQGRPEQWGQTPFRPTINKAAKRAIEETIDVSNLTPILELSDGDFSVTDHPTGTVFAYMQERLATRPGFQPERNISEGRGIPDRPTDINLLATLLLQARGEHDYQYQEEAMMTWLSRTKVGAVVESPVLRRRVLAVTGAHNLHLQDNGSVKVGNCPIHVIPSGELTVGDTAHAYRNIQTEKLQRINSLHVFSL